MRRLIRHFTSGFPKRSRYPKGIAGLLDYLREIAEKAPGLSRLMRLQPAIALITSLICIFLLRKGFEHVPVAIVSAVFAFVCLIFGLNIKKDSAGIMPKVWNMAFLFALNDMLFFVLPFYFESMTFPSRNTLFAPLIIGLTVIANWYYLYERFIYPNPVAGSIFYSATFFCVLNFLFPIIFGMRNIWSLLLSGIIASIVLILFVYPRLPALKNRRNALLGILSVIILLAGLWFGRSLIPPAPLKLTYATACEGIEGLSPLNPFDSGEIEAGKEVFFYSSIFAPRGLSEKINHVWHYNGRRLFTVKLSEISGGRKEGFRTWSSHLLAKRGGTYTVEVWTAGGQLLGAKDFFVR